MRRVGSNGFDDTPQPLLANPGNRLTSPRNSMLELARTSPDPHSDRGTTITGSRNLGSCALFSVLEMYSRQ